MSARVSLVQMVSSKHVEPNLNRAEQLILEAAREDVSCIFLPENFAALGSDDPHAIGAGEKDAGGPIRAFLSDVARRSGCWIFAGTCPTTTHADGVRVAKSRVRAASLVFDQDGVEVARYDKIHMFDVLVTDNIKTYRESATFEPGTEVVSVDCPLGKVGLTVCYDIRFPELYRKLFVDGAMAFAIPSAFTQVTGEAHFELLMRARAIENSAFTIAACQGGAHDSDRRTWGHSMVVDPWGTIVGECGQGEDILTVDLNLEKQAELKKEMPFLEQRRLGELP